MKIQENEPVQHFGKTPAANVFKECPGVKRIFARQIHCARDAFSLLITDEMISCIKSHSENAGFTTSIPELKAFIGLMFARGVYGRQHTTDWLWSQYSGIEFFKDTMPRDRFCQIKRNMRFDDRSNRNKRRKLDPFGKIREVFEASTQNIRAVYTPHFSLCVDEQLMPSKNRSKLITYMPNKPDKYGIKFWMLVDNESKFVYNVLPYLGAYDKETRQGVGIAEDAVLRLMRGLLDRGYNVTADNFFTSPHLASILLKKVVFKLLMALSG
jgi:hypothetical protein